MLFTLFFAGVVIILLLIAADLSDRQLFRYVSWITAAFFITAFLFNLMTWLHVV